MPHRSRTYLICLLGALAMGVVVPQASAAASSCNETAIYNQAYTGKITGHFSIACLQKARRDESAEMATYSNVDSVIAAAINKAQFVKTYRKANSDQVTPTQSVDNGSTGVTSTGGTVAASGGHSSSPPAQSTAGVPIVDPPTHPGPLTRALASTGPAKADDIPTPIIVLGALTTLFVLGGIGSYLLRRRLDRGSTA